MKNNLIFLFLVAFVSGCSNNTTSHLVLPLNTETTHFRLYCMNEVREAAMEVLEVSEKNFQKLSEAYRHRYSTKINLYVFSSIQEFHNAIGEPSADDRWIINASEDTHSILTVSPHNAGAYHTQDTILQLNIFSLNHLFIKDAYTKKELPSWLVLGLGIVMAGWENEAVLKKLAHNHSLIPSFQDLEKYNSRLDADLRAIYQNFSASVVQYIRHKFCWEKVLALLADCSSFEEILGMKQEVLREQWITYLDTNYLG